VTANAQSKVYGSDDPALTYVPGGFVPGDTAATVLSGSLSRVAGENAGNTYDIEQNTLRGEQQLHHRLHRSETHDHARRA